MRNLLWQSDAWKEYENLQAERATLKKVNKLLTEDRKGNRRILTYFLDGLVV